MINSGDTAWVLISTALVILMTPALGFFYAGTVRKKNVLSTLMLSVVMLALITPALITGAFVVRIKFPSFLLFSLLWATFIYAPVAHWVWGIGGWLRAMGALDFAGGIVVHITAGISALAVALVIGKRKGYGRTPMEPSNIPLTVLGAFLLWFGWFGFNGGSALSASSIAVSAVVATNAAGASAALTWMLLNWMPKRPSLLGFSTGAIVGLAAVTPASGFISPLSALIIGVVAATLSYYMIIFRLKVGLDESLDVFACHGIGGIWGTLALGLFAQKAINATGNDGLFFGNPGFFGIQIFAVLIVVLFSFVGTYFLAKVVDTLFSLRSKESEEDVGLDLAYHGETTY